MPLAHSRRTALKIIFSAALTSPISTRHAFSRNADEHSLAAALTLRISKFITWPERPTIPADRPYFILGVMGNARSQNAFAKYEGKLIKGRKFKTVRIEPSTDPHDLRRCHVVFSDSTASPRLIDSMIGKSKGILTVRGPGSKITPCACLTLSTTSGKIAFDIDLGSTRIADLKIDAGIIKLARNVTR